MKLPGWSVTVLLIPVALLIVFASLPAPPLQANVAPDTVGAVSQLQDYPAPTATNTPVFVYAPVVLRELVTTPTFTPTPTNTSTPTPTNTPTATPTSTPTPIPETCEQLLVNSGFEDDTGWFLPTTSFSADYTTERAYAGTRSLRTGIPLDGENDDTFNSAYQVITLPADANTITLSAQLWRGHAETLSTNSHFGEDFQYVQIKIVDGAHERLFQGLLNSQMWESVEFDISGYRGNQVEIRFGVYNNDLGKKTVMYVDEALVLSCTE